MKTQYLIVPAFSDQAGQCRIVARTHEHVHPQALQHYRNHADQWKEVGIMNSWGKLVCLEAPQLVIQGFKDCEPLGAGMTMAFDAVEIESGEGVSSAAGMRTIKVSEATDREVDWLVAVLQGVEVDEQNEPIWFGDEDAFSPRLPYSPRSDWSIAGPILNKMLQDGCTIGKDRNGRLSVHDWTSNVTATDDDNVLAAAMRCYIVSKLGEEADVPLMLPMDVLALQDNPQEQAVRHQSPRG